MKPSRRRYLSIALCVLLILCLATLGAPIKSSALPRAAPSDEGFLGSFPDYDSGWEDIAAGASETFSHKLDGDTDDYVVSLMFKRPGGAHHLYFGGDWYRDKVEGAFWYDLTTTEIKVQRGPDDGDAEQVRVRIWVVPEDDYHSDWVAPDPELTLDHGIKGNTDNFLVYLVARQDEKKPEPHQVHYGSDVRRPGMTPDWDGFYWYDLTSTQITVVPDAGHGAGVVRLRIWLVPEADFATEWLSLPAGDWDEVSHDLSCPGEVFFVDMQFKDSGGDRHHWGYGFDRFQTLLPDLNYECGATWYDLDGDSIRFRSGGSSCLYTMPQVRFRIWGPVCLYIPLTLRHYLP